MLITFLKKGENQKKRGKEKKKGKRKRLKYGGIARNTVEMKLEKNGEVRKQIVREKKRKQGRIL